MPDKSLSILEGAITATGWNNIRSDGISRMYFEALAKQYHFSLTRPVKDSAEEVRSIILYGTGGEKLELHYDQPRGKGTLYQAFEGICQQPGAPLPGDPVSDCHASGSWRSCMSECPCPDCQGKRLKQGGPGGDRGGHGHLRRSVPCPWWTTPWTLWTGWS